MCLCMHWDGSVNSPQRISSRLEACIEVGGCKNDVLDFPIHHVLYQCSGIGYVDCIKNTSGIHGICFVLAHHFTGKRVAQIIPQS